MTVVVEAPDSAEAIKSRRSMVMNRQCGGLNWLFDKPYLFYPLFVALVVSPLSKYTSRWICHVYSWQQVLWSSGVFVGIGYLLSGLVMIIFHPFRSRRAERGHLQQYAYTMFIPLGIGMILRHEYQRRVRLGHYGTSGHGHTVADSPAIVACTLGQMAWLTTWGVWFVRALAYHNNPESFSRLLGQHSVDDDPDGKDCRVMARRVVLALSICSSSILVLVTLVRLGIFTYCGCGFCEFYPTYFGGGAVWNANASNTSCLRNVGQ